MNRPETDGATTTRWGTVATWWLGDRRPGRAGLVVGQAPNVSSVLTGVTAATGLALAMTGRPRAARTAAVLAWSAGSVWGAGELVSGINPFRRGLGALTVVTLAWLAVRWQSRAAASARVTHRPGDDGR
jgi:hypothetical protein